MRPTRILLVAFLAFVVPAAQNLAQPPGKPSKEDRGKSSGGSDGQDGRSYGRGGQGSRGSRGDRAGRGGPSKAGDPNSFFDKLSGGKDVWKRSESDSRGQRAFDGFADKVGAKNGEITRQQFLTYMESKDAKNGVTPAPGTPGASDPNNAARYDKVAEFSFRALDKNGDGVLDYNEMPEDLKAERDKWDTNHNGVIDLTEYKAYYAAKRDQRRADYSAARGSYSGGMSPGAAPIMPGTNPGKTEPQKPLVYTKNNLPKDVPSWFRSLADADAQIAFFQWKAAGRSFGEFQKYDLNHDGFITVDEVLAYQSQAKKATGGKPNFTVVRGGETVAGSPASTAPAASPTPIRLGLGNFPPSPGSRFSQFNLNRNRGGQSGGSTEKH